LTIPWEEMVSIRSRSQRIKSEAPSRFSPQAVNDRR
jgi:hypothetical protein